MRSSLGGARKTHAKRRLRDKFLADHLIHLKSAASSHIRMRFEEVDNCLYRVRLDDGITTDFDCGCGAIRRHLRDPMSGSTRVNDGTTCSVQPLTKRYFCLFQYCWITGQLRTMIGY